MHAPSVLQFAAFFRPSGHFCLASSNLISALPNVARSRGRDQRLLETGLLIREGSSPAGSSEMSGNESGLSDTAAAGKKRRSTSNNSGGGASTTAVERKEIERMRRQHMKSLCAKLASLIPKEHYSSKDAMTQMGSLDEAAAYIKKLKERVDELQQKRSSARLMAGIGGGAGGGASTSAATATSGNNAGSEGAGEELVEAPPVVEVQHHDDGSSLDVVLISGVERPFKMHEVITVLEEEGAEVINANLNVSGRKIFYTIHARAFSPRIGIEISRVSERLRALV